ncbi:MAG TPA: nuclear transport factor 2 family protein [Trebonia sp.]
MRRPDPRSTRTAQQAPAIARKDHPTMSDFTKLAEQYIAAWNETSPSARRALIDEIWSADGRYIDPLAEVTGRDQIDAVIAAAQAQFAGMTFRLAGPVDAHHDQARFTWELGPDGTAVVVGFDVAQRDADGRLALVLGFLDKVPSAA